MLRAYFDESEDPSAGVFCLAGWVSVPSAWRHFSEAWSKMLDAAPRPVKHGFHMKDIAHRTGEFAEWSTKELTALVTSAVDVILDTKLNTTMYALGCTVVKPEIFRQQTTTYDMYQLCYEGVFRELFASFPIQNGVALVFDAKEKVKKDVQNHFNAVKKIIEQDFPGKLESCSFQSDEDSPPLQAADFLAYERRKRTQDRVAGLDRLRISYQRLRDGRPHTFRERERGREMLSQNLPIPHTKNARSIENLLTDEWSSIRKHLRDSAAGL